MKLSYLATLAAIGLSSLGLIVSTQGCSSEKKTDDTGGASGAGRPPAKPSAAAADLSKRQVFALRKLYLGDTDRTGKRDANAWKKFGYNLDDKNTKSPDAKDVCKPKGGPVVTDGDNGIDNTFGGTILPILSNLLTDPSTTASNALENGEFTVMLDIKGLTEDPKQTNTGLSGQLFPGGSFGGPDGGAKPTWGGTDDWPVRPELLTNPTDPSAGSKVKFDDAYITNGTWVSGSGSSVQFGLTFGGVSIDLLVQSAYIVANHEGNKLTGGTVAGFIALKDLIDSITKVAGRINTSACPGKPNYKLVVDTLTSAADMKVDGSGAGECDAVSIGIGFDAQTLAPPTKVAESAAASPDPCLTASDAGTD